jgi:hypothetical protein
MNDIARLKWQSAVAECRLHAERLNSALAHLASRMPLDGSTLAQLGDAETARLDQLLYRFSKLQDTLGERVFVDGLLLLGEDFRDRPFLDALNRLEALSMIPSCLWWRELREFRNQVAHEYPERRSEQAAAINAIYAQCAGLVQVFNDFVRTVEAKAFD